MVRIQGALLVGVSAWDLPDKEKLQPFITSCQGLDNMAGCNTVLTGTCMSEGGQRYCLPDFRRGHHHHGHHGDHEGHRKHDFLRGDCENKQDNEACTLEHEGFCVSSGKCPLFQGQTVCKTKAFMTEPCEGKSEGNACAKKFHGSGKCLKAPTGELVCLSDVTPPPEDPREPERPWHHHGHEHEHHDEPHEHHWPHPGREKFQPLVDACQGLDADAACSTTLTGTCKADEEDGKMYCTHECHGKPEGQPWSKRVPGPKHEGNCGGKSAGETCSVQKEGVCVSSGKCPVFHGEMVCKAKDAHPPSFVTEPCNGKAAGDACETWRGPGKCQQFFEDVVCRPSQEQWHHGHHHEHGEHGEHGEQPWHHGHHHEHGEHHHEHHHGHHEHGEHRDHEHRDHQLRQPQQSAAFGAAGKSGAAPPSWLEEKLHWVSGVPTWWSEDGHAHWTSVAV